MFEHTQEDIERMLYAACDRFISQNKIHCAEDIYQTDHVIQNAYELIEDICDLVGYYSEHSDSVR